MATAKKIIMMKKLVMTMIKSENRWRWLSWWWWRWFMTDVRGIKIIIINIRKKERWTVRESDRGREKIKQWSKRKRNFKVNKVRYTKWRFEKEESKVKKRKRFRRRARKTKRGARWKTKASLPSFFLALFSLWLYSLFCFWISLSFPRLMNL